MKCVFGRSRFRRTREERGQALAREGGTEEVSEEVDAMILEEVLPFILQTRDPETPRQNLVHFTEILNEDVPIEVNVLDLRQFAIFALERFLKPAPL
jgi:hypothetical protein